MRCRLVFDYKRDSAGKFVRWKVRLVACGYSQIEGLDYKETYSPVARMESQRIAFFLAASLDLEMEQLDIKTAFLHGDLNEEIWMEQPDGFKEEGREDWVWKLKKGLYGLKQGSRIWNKKLDGKLVQMGFTKLSMEWSIYCRRSDTGVSIIVLHVDDMNVLGDSNEEIGRVKALKEEFDVVELGPVEWIVGLRVRRDRAKRLVYISQTALIDDIIKQFNQTDASPVITPLDHNIRLSHDDSPAPDDTEHKNYMAKIPYRQLIGCLMYLALGTRPDIAFSVNFLSQFNANPGRNHWQGAIHVVWYLKRTRNLELQLGGTGPIELNGFCDSSYGGFAGPSGSRCSTSGFGFSLGIGSGLISWSSKRQAVTATSTSEAEYMACAHAAKEALWLRNVLDQLGFGCTTATVIQCDNQSSISLTRNQGQHDKIKHIDI